MVFTCMRPRLASAASASFEAGAEQPPAAHDELGRHVQLAVGSFEDGAHLGEGVDAHARHELALADIRRRVKAIAEAKRGRDRRRIAIDDQRQRLCLIGDVGGKMHGDRYQRGILGLLGRIERQRAIVLGDVAPREDPGADVGPWVVVCTSGRERQYKTEGQAKHQRKELRRAHLKSSGSSTSARLKASGIPDANHSFGGSIFSPSRKLKVPSNSRLLGSASGVTILRTGTPRALSM